MNCGAELYPVKDNKLHFEKSYLILWAVMCALMLGLFWVATRDTEREKAFTNKPVHNQPEIPVQPQASPVLNIANKHVLEEEAKSAILNYATAVSNGNKAAALTFWKNPTAQVSRQLEKLRSMQVISLKPDVKSERNADVWVDMVVSSLGTNNEHWRGTIVQERPGGSWLIVSMRGMECIEGCSRVSKSNSPIIGESTDTYLSEGPMVKSVVSSYYQALSNNNGSAARSKWRSPPKLLNKIIGRIDYAMVNRIDDPIIKGTNASIWADVSIKSKGKSHENWKGAIELERFGASGWLITSMVGMKQR
jgi:hypothetical protein